MVYTCKLNKLECKHKCIVVTSPSSFLSFPFVTWLDIPLLIVHVVIVMAQRHHRENQKDDFDKDNT